MQQNSYLHKPNFMGTSIWEIYHLLTQNMQWHTNPLRDHFQSLASLIWCPDPEPLSFNYGSHSLTRRQDSSWGHHHMCKYTCMCMTVFHTVFNFWTNQFSDNLVEISENVKEVNATNKQSIQFIWHRTLTSSSIDQVTLRGWSRSGFWLFLHLFWMWHWCWFLKRIKYDIKIQITDETDHKSMCWLNAEELCKAHKMDQSKPFKHSTVSTTLNSTFTNTKWWLTV
jgi:hypothetical protein